MEIAYYLEFFGRILPAVLTIAVIFTFFIVQSFGRKLERMAFFLDRIDNHLREITYFIKAYEREKGSGSGKVSTGEDKQPGDNPENAGK